MVLLLQHQIQIHILCAYSPLIINAFFSFHEMLYSKFPKNALREKLEDVLIRVGTNRAIKVIGCPVWHNSLIGHWTDVIQSHTDPDSIVWCLDNERSGFRISSKLKKRQTNWIGASPVLELDWFYKNFQPLSLFLFEPNYFSKSPTSTTQSHSPSSSWFSFSLPLKLSFWISMSFLFSL